MSMNEAACILGQTGAFQRGLQYTNPGLCICRYTLLSDTLLGLVKAKVQTCYGDFSLDLATEMAYRLQKHYRNE